MKIRLNEVPQDGRAYTYDRTTAELTPDLQDLIGEQDYKVDLFIKPIGNAYEMRGSMATSLNEVCSSCGYDFVLPISRNINEILFEEQADERKAQSVHGNQSVDFFGSSVSATAVKGDIFDPGAFVHEAIALEEPSYPMCGANGECNHREEVLEIQRKLENDFALATAQEKTEGHPAFSVLKGLELKN